ncbi:unnamed protein product [Trifolium pratense]|uniref:Uncharacterized protein n=1 Tax=Trifolium pratense TaxID=57577 RepID=A0ACB0J7F7_TRIPR|nr:unnamed protein product [Trifolium pratense]
MTLSNTVKGGSSPLTIAVARNRTVVLPTKSSVNHHWTKVRGCVILVDIGFALFLKLFNYRTKKYIYI